MPLPRAQSVCESEYKVKLSSASLHTFERENHSDDKLAARIERNVWKVLIS